MCLELKVYYIGKVKYEYYGSFKTLSSELDGVLRGRPPALWLSHHTAITLQFIHLVQMVLAAGSRGCRSQSSSVRIRIIFPLLTEQTWFLPSISVSPEPSWHRLSVSTLIQPRISCSSGVFFPLHVDLLQSAQWDDLCCPVSISTAKGARGEAGGRQRVRQARRPSLLGAVSCGPEEMIGRRGRSPAHSDYF